MFWKFRRFRCIANVLSTIVALFLIVGAVLLGRSTLRGSVALTARGFARAPGVAYLVVILLVPLFKCGSGGSAPFIRATRSFSHRAPLRPVWRRGIDLVGPSALHGRIYYRPVLRGCCRGKYMVHPSNASISERASSNRRRASFPPSDNLERTRRYQSLRLHAGENPRRGTSRSGVFEKSIRGGISVACASSRLDSVLHHNPASAETAPQKDQSMATATYVLRPRQ